MAASVRRSDALSRSIDAGGAVIVSRTSFATRSPAVPDLLAELGLADDVVVPAAQGAWLQLAHGYISTYQEEGRRVNLLVVRETPSTANGSR